VGYRTYGKRGAGCLVLLGGLGLGALLLLKTLA
jgi:hypothetical protein